MTNVPGKLQEDGFTPGPGWKYDGVCFVDVTKPHGNTQIHRPGTDLSNVYGAAPDLLAGLDGTLHLIRKAQDILTMYLHPDSYDADHAVNLLLELLDGPEQRAIETPARAAIAKARKVSP